MRQWKGGRGKGGEVGGAVYFQARNFMNHQQPERSGARAENGGVVQKKETPGDG